MCLPSSNWPVVRNAGASIRRLENVVCYAQISGLGDAASPMPVNSRLHGDDTAAFSRAVLAKVESSRARAHTRTHTHAHIYIHSLARTFKRTQTHPHQCILVSPSLNHFLTCVRSRGWMRVCTRAHALRGEHN